MGTLIGGYINPLFYTPALWIDFSDSGTVSLSGSDITQVTDKSGNGRTFTQGTGANRPTYESAVQNGLNVARFNGTSDRLELGSSGLARNVDGVTIYVVHKWSALPTSMRSIIGITIGTSASTARCLMYGGSPANKAGAGGRRLDADGFTAVSSTNNVNTSFSLSTGIFDYANSDLFLYFGSTLEGSTTSFHSNGSTSNTASQAVSIGSNAPTGTQFFNGDIGEVLVFHSAHDAATRARVWGYLKHKWAI
jgi:hypothetical protein